jgi:Protein of unknown function (DUF5818)
LVPATDPPILPVKVERQTKGTTIRRNVRRALIAAATMLLGTTLPGVPGPRPPQGAVSQRSFSLIGQIMDSRCAIEGSHNKMMSQNGTTNIRDCTVECAKKSGSFVLYDPDTKIVYQLDDQDKPEKFAGQRVRVSGTYDQSSKTIHIQSVEAAN